MESIFSNFIQLYTTAKCAMGCARCSSKNLQMPDMSLDIFEKVIWLLKFVGVKRFEFFANDPLLTELFNRFIAVSNNSNLDYGILTVGKSPYDPEVEKSFRKIVDRINPEKGSFVFSADYTAATAQKIIKRKIPGDFSCAFKAKTFWEIAPILVRRGISCRTNTVISVNNHREVPEILRQVTEMGMATSFCFTQYERNVFNDISECGFHPDYADDFKVFLDKTGLLSSTEVNSVVSEVDKLIEAGMLKKQPKIFNAFRGKNTGEGNIPRQELDELRNKLLELKWEFKKENSILPNEDFIRNLGKEGNGCINLIRQGKFPCLKIGSEGQMKACCDLHDPLTAKYSITDLMDENKLRDFSDSFRINPYILFCCFANPCDFSVNYVNFIAKSAEK